MIITFCSLVQRELLEKSKKENQELQADLANAIKRQQKYTKENEEHVSFV